MHALVSVVVPAVPKRGLDPPAKDSLIFDPLRTMIRSGTAAAQPLPTRRSIVAGLITLGFSVFALGAYGAGDGTGTPVERPTE
jgi:hypothetical protein